MGKSNKFRVANAILFFIRFDFINRLEYNRSIRKGDNKNMKRLTKTEEQQIIYSIMDRDEFLGNGSSRAVFGYTDSLVVKIAIDKQGQRQNANEINVYRDYGSSLPIAEITAYGKNIVVMERINPLDTYEVESVFNDEPYEETDDDDETYESYRDGDYVDAIKQTVFDLEGINGETSDNYQIGYNSNGKIVAYDYGYYTGGSGDLVSRNLEGFLGNTSERFFLEFLATRLNGSQKNTRRVIREQQKQIKEMVRWR